jgi:hypothetical protein
MDERPPDVDGVGEYTECPVVDNQKAVVLQKVWWARC